LALGHNATDDLYRVSEARWRRRTGDEHSDMIIGSNSSVRSATAEHTGNMITRKFVCVTNGGGKSISEEGVGGKTKLWKSESSRWETS
jgi:hypothetical protein